MGKPKQNLKLGGQTFVELISITARKLNLPVTIVDHDLIPGQGPLGGVVTALAKHPCDAGLFLSCDTPLIRFEFLRELLGRFEATASPIFSDENGQFGFPFLVPASVQGILREQIESGYFSLQSFARRIKARSIPIPAEYPDEFLNVNTPADFKAIQSTWAENQKRNANIVLRLAGINVRRGETQLIADFDWSIARGEHWVILGANGSGKTTLLSALLGYITPTSGEIMVLGEEYGEADWPKLRKKIGVVSSSVRQMMPENEPAWITVASGKYAVIDFWGNPTPADRRNALKILKLIECEYLADRPWGVLSQGERQRVLIGRALMSQPSLLILDEPCAGLDPAAREHFLQFIDRLAKGKFDFPAPALVLVTHHVEEIMPFFTHILFLKNGRKLCEGKVSEMLNDANLASAFSAPMCIERRGERYSLSVGDHSRNIF